VVKGLGVLVKMSRVGKDFWGTSDEKYMFVFELFQRREKMDGECKEST